MNICMTDRRVLKITCIGDYSIVSYDEACACMSGHYAYPHFKAHGSGSGGFAFYRLLPTPEEARVARLARRLKASRSGRRLFERFTSWAMEQPERGTADCVVMAVRWAGIQGYGYDERQALVNNIHERAA